MEDLHKVCTQFPTKEPKKLRVNTSWNLIELADEDKNCLEKIITSDESRCFPYDPATKYQSIEWCGPREGRPVRIYAVKSKVKMLICFFLFSGH